jgi:hypothetical protein
VIVVIDDGSVDQTADLVTRIWSGRVPVQLTGCAQPGKGEVEVTPIPGLG